MRTVGKMTGGLLLVEMAEDELIQFRSWAQRAVEYLTSLADLCQKSDPLQPAGETIHERAPQAQRKTEKATAKVTGEEWRRATCTICHKTFGAKAPNQKCCSPKCVAEKNRRYRPASR